MGGLIICCLTLLPTKDKAASVTLQLFRPPMVAVLALQGKSGYLRMLLLLPLYEPPPPPNSPPPQLWTVDMCWLHQWMLPTNACD